MAGKNSISVVKGCCRNAILRMMEWIVLVVLDAIKKNPTVTIKQLSELLGYSEKTAARMINTLSEKGIIESVGSSKTGTWKIK